MKAKVSSLEKKGRLIGSGIVAGYGLSQKNKKPFLIGGLYLLATALIGYCPFKLLTKMAK